MYKQTLLLGILFIFSIVGIFSCGKTVDEPTLISDHNLTKSHNPSQNCASCHKKGGTGPGIFTASGTIYDSFQNNLYPNTYIRFYSGPNATGTLKYTIKGDKFGNFYTTAPMDLSAGLYVSVQGINASKHMSTPVYMAECNSCHNKKITDRIWCR
jgi:cytochrome c553